VETLHSSGHRRMLTEDGKAREADKDVSSAFRQFGQEEAFGGHGSRVSTQEETEEGGRKNVDGRGISDGDCGYAGGDGGGYHTLHQGSGVAELPAAATGGSTRGEWEWDCIRYTAVGRKVGDGRQDGSYKMDKSEEGLEEESGEESGEELEE